MRKEDVIRSIILAIIIIFIAANINGINSFLSVHTDRTIDFGHSETVVPQAWNTTEELNLTNHSKTPHAITNEYVYIDHWDDWPEDHITSVSDAKFASMEDGGYEVLKRENSTISGVPVSKNTLQTLQETIMLLGAILESIMFSLKRTPIMQFRYITSQPMTMTTILSSRKLMTVLKMTWQTSTTLNTTDLSQE